MKTLLIPTDFSKNADHAARYGLSIAQKTNATVILLNSYELPYADTVMTTSLLEVMRKNSNEQLEALKKKYNAEFPDVDIDIMSSMNNSIRAIKTHAERLQVRLELERERRQDLNVSLHNVWCPDAPLLPTPEKYDAAPRIEVRHFCIERCLGSGPLLIFNMR